MATFYLLPSRESLVAALGSFVGPLLPGLPLADDAWDRFAEHLSASGRWPADVFLIPRDDLPAEESVYESLVNGFGAEPGDRVIESGSNGSHLWVIPDHDEPLDEQATSPVMGNGTGTLRLIR